MAVLAIVFGCVLVGWAGSMDVHRCARSGVKTTCNLISPEAVVCHGLDNRTTWLEVTGSQMMDLQCYPGDMTALRTLKIRMTVIGCGELMDRFPGVNVFIGREACQGITTTTTTATTSTDGRNASWPFIVPHRRRPVGAQTTTTTTGTTTTLRYIFVARLTTPDYVYALVAICTVSVSGLAIVVACIWRRRRRVLENRLPISLPATNLDDSEPETIGATLMVQLPESPRKRQRKPAHFSGSEDTLFEFTSVKLE